MMTSTRHLFAAVLLLAILALQTSAASVSPDEARHEFTFSAWQGSALRVFVARPPDLAPGDPVVLVMHGMSRTAEKERDTWHELALENRFLLIVPEFSQRDFPGSRNYNLGNLSGPEGQPVSRELWTFSAIEPLFDNVKKRYRMTTPSYSIFGHSAGAQFVHRFLLLFDAARVERAVAANAGWYTMPDFNTPYPYGLADSSVTPENLRHALGLSLTVLLGDRDTDVAHESLRTTPEALAQGPHRLGRGFSFFEAGRKAAEKLDAPFNWHLSTVRGAGHDSSLVAPAAVHYLLPD
jgi:poly(3-hydroxybutyrate) depolymerase